MDLKTMLQNEEGLSLVPYRDHLGFLTVGWGHRTNSHSTISLEEADRLLDEDIAKAEAGVRKALPWFDDMNEVRQAVLIAMAFQIGLRGLLVFKKTLRYVERGSYVLAAHEMLDSRWAEQTPARAGRMSRMMLTGKWV